MNADAVVRKVKCAITETTEGMRGDTSRAHSERGSYPKAIAPDPGGGIVYAAGVEMTYVDQTRPVDDRGHPSTRRAHRSGHVLMAEGFDSATIQQLRDTARAVLRIRGLDDDRTWTFVAAINEGLANAVQHGGGEGWFILIDDETHFVASVIDHGPGAAITLPRQQPDLHALDGRGLWLIQQMVDRMTIMSGTDGTTLRLEMAQTSTTIDTRPR